MILVNWIFNRQIKEAVGADDPDFPEDDGRISLINRATTQTLEALLGRSLTKTTHTETFTTKINGRNFYDIFGGFAGGGGVGTAFKTVRYKLKHFPVDPNSVTISLTPYLLVDRTEQLLTTEFDIDYEKGELVILRSIAAEVYKGLSVTYDAGYVSTVDTDANVVYNSSANPPQEQALANNIPADLVQAAIYQAMHVYEKQKFSNINVRESRSQGSTNASRYINIHAIAPEAMAIIMMHKRYRVRFV
jgi:hypothetical protein